ncbi:HAMP domain-containing histidine kinase [Eggerthellaceae bacterium zg-1084]|uniref:histidine kinase n=2 Tax=Berryella wangjianweii TaxID=2734634 RepID=A0A6M8J272_9ACTN|nr:HAMP domain-containing histidine kinase [Berryella wangjianweii]NPD32024.1 HAMP domain-containing histidine kinase [Eggerthellaceae bacterium zg-997]QKF08020.1 HAMP domain-containing histidine kinase [Berryella wangjianweii]
MTALIAIGVVSFVWEQYFQMYTRDNMQAVADTTAELIAERYAESGAFTEQVVAPADYAVTVYQGIGVQVAAADGTVVYDSTVAKALVGNVEIPSLAPNQGKTNTARAAVVVDTRAVGSVRVWVEGSDTLLRNADEEFRERSYQAMVWATVIAVILASLIGYLFARSLVRPIRRMTDTAASMAQGDLSARTGLSGQDEVSKLGQTFDAMAESVERDRRLERRLTTDVAHELRTPLMAIQSTVEAMVDGVYPTDEEHLGTVSSEVQRLSRLVDSLLKLSRLENRSTPLKEEVVDVGSLIKAIVTMHDSYVRDAGLTLSYRAEPGVCVLGDPDMIRQATANLISNAVRYTPEGGITVRVGREDGMATIAVSDTGVGLTSDEAQRVFDRFWRADAHRSRESGGLGIGLSVVREIIDRHHGRVGVEGEPGVGATFTLYLPLYDERAAQKAARKRS